MPIDPYTAGVVLKSLLASVGIKITLALVLLAGMFWLAWKFLQLAKEGLGALLASRDKERQAFLEQTNGMVKTLMGQSAEEAKSRLAYQNAQTRIMEQIAGNIGMLSQKIDAVKHEVRRQKGVSE